MRRTVLCTIATLLIGLANGCATSHTPLAAADSPATQPAKAKPVILFVHGAWGGAWSFQQLDSIMTADGFKVYRPTLTGLGEKVHLATPDIGLDTHIMDIVNVIKFENLHDIILVGHSYGGMVISGVAEKVPDRIGRMIYIDALLPNDGESVDDVFPRGRDMPRANGFIPFNWATNPTPPMDVPQPAKTFSDKITLNNPAAAKIPVTYVLTVDQGNQPSQDEFYSFYQRAIARGYKTAIMTGPHNVQRDMPKETAKLLESLLAN
jgi:pimeloyl-ACP methyl ester carboxylesterase